LILEHLSDIELYFSTQVDEEKKKITLNGDEFKHAFKVMRHRSGDILYITNGKGYIFKSEIISVKKDFLISVINGTIKRLNNFNGICFCIPMLKNPERLKFAIEKSVELGITDFVLFSSNRTVGRIKNLERYQKIITSAMKQSLRAYLPELSSLSLLEISQLKGRKILLDQKAEADLDVIVKDGIQNYFIFGPEGGFDEDELKLFSVNDIYNLSFARLRSETAVVACASLLQNKFNKKPG